MNHKLPDEETMRRAFYRRDSRFEGIFFVAVNTTGIFCRPTCRARKPKPENIRFFATARQALYSGYRPCKVCRPLNSAGQAPDWLQPLLEEIGEKEGVVISNTELKRRGLDPSRVRRWFQKQHGMTFQDYLRALRISGAFGRIQNGGRVIDAAYDSGYESLSGFTGSFKRGTGFSPNKSGREQIIRISRLATPLGPMLAGAGENGLCLLEFSDRRMLETQLKRVERLFNARLLPGKSPYFDQAARQLEEYFAGERREFTVPVEAPGTPFQCRVWEALQQIPYGEIRSYRQQAEAVGRPRAVRAVARANGDNRLAILIPCHRVIGHNGDLTGYGGGLWRKRYLLELESGRQ